jgi:hypothetical protein
MDVQNHWKFLRKYSTDISDFYLTVSLSSLHFLSMNAEVNTQISTRRTEFEKPIEFYTLVDIYGRNTPSSDGHDWRRQPKIISLGFIEKNKASVWELSLK